MPSFFYYEKIMSYNEGGDTMMSILFTIFIICLVYKFAYKPASNLLMGLIKSLIGGLAEVKSTWNEKMKK